MPEATVRGEELDACIDQQGVHYIGGRDPLGPAARRAAARGGSSTRGCASPTLTLMGCGSSLGLGRWLGEAAALGAAPPQP
jgi:hypothetical protein